MKQRYRHRQSGSTAYRLQARPALRPAANSYAPPESGV